MSLIRFALFTIRPLIGRSEFTERSWCIKKKVAAETEYYVISFQ